MLSLERGGKQIMFLLVCMVIFVPLMRTRDLMENLIIIEKLFNNSSKALVRFIVMVVKIQNSFVRV